MEASGLKDCLKNFGPDMLICIGAKKIKINHENVNRKKISVGKYSSKTCIVFKVFGYENEISSLSQKVIN